MNKHHRIFLLVYCFSVLGITYLSSQQIDSTHFSDKYYHRKSVYESMPNKGGEIVFFGNSITEQGTWGELFGNTRIINRGIGGDTSDGLLFRLDEIIASKPIKIFMLIGTNDLKYGKSTDYILERIAAIVTKTKKESPLTQIYLQSVLPTLGRPERPISKIKKLNEGLWKLSDQEGVIFINMFKHFSNKNNGDQLYKEFTRDGLHLNGRGYLKWKELIQEHVSDNASERLQRNLKRIKNPKDSYVFVIAHRGDWRHAPENSIASLQRAINMGVDMVETDLQMTKDGKLVVFHDKTLERTTNGQGLLVDFTYEELLEFHLLDGLGNVTEFQIPLLTEYLEISKNKVLLDLDIKSNIPFESIGRLLKEKDMLGQVVVRSYRDYKEANEYYGSYLNQLLYFPGINAKIKEPLKYIQEFEAHLNPIAYVPSFNEYDKDMVEIFNAISKNNDRIWVHSITDSRSGGHGDNQAITDPEGNYGWLVGKEVRFIQTDHPQFLLDFLREKNLHE